MVTVDSSLVNVILGTGVVGVILILMIFGFLVPKSTVDELKEDNKNLKIALEKERLRSDVAVQTGIASTQLIAALREIAEDRRKSDYELEQDRRKGWQNRRGEPSSGPDQGDPP